MKPKGADVYINVPNSSVDGGRKEFCPLCYYDMIEVVMVFDTIAQSWKCNRCKYILDKHQNPVGDPKITAGNDMATQRPYMRSISFTRKAPSMGKNQTFTSAAQAWESD